MFNSLSAFYAREYESNKVMTIFHSKSASVPRDPNHSKAKCAWDPSNLLISRIIWKDCLGFYWIYAFFAMFAKSGDVLGLQSDGIDCSEYVCVSLTSVILYRFHQTILASPHSDLAKVPDKLKPLALFIRMYNYKNYLITTHQQEFSTGKGFKCIKQTKQSVAK